MPPGNTRGELHGVFGGSMVNVFTALPGKG